jgi:hypothetical protein
MPLWHVKTAFTMEFSPQRTSSRISWMWKYCGYNHKNRHLIGICCTVTGVSQWAEGSACSPHSRYLRVRWVWQVLGCVGIISFPQMALQQDFRPRTVRFTPHSLLPCVFVAQWRYAQRSVTMAQSKGWTSYVAASLAIASVTFPQSLCVASCCVSRREWGTKW